MLYILTSNKTPPWLNQENGLTMELDKKIPQYFQASVLLPSDSPLIRHKYDPNEKPFIAHADSHISHPRVMAWTLSLYNRPLTGPWMVDDKIGPVSFFGESFQEGGF